MYLHCNETSDKKYFFKYERESMISNYSSF